MRLADGQRCRPLPTQALHTGKQTPCTVPSALPSLYLGLRACSHSSSGSCRGRMPGSLQDVMSSVLAQATASTQLQQHRQQRQRHRGGGGSGKWGCCQGHAGVYGRDCCQLVRCSNGRDW